MDEIECVVVGAGVVGLACARALADAGREVVVLEAAKTIGTGTSSRNSEVIHAGIYYPAGSLKARLCVAGKAALYDYCASRQVPHRRCGKLIVATDESQRPALESIRARAAASGVGDLEWLDRSEVQALEPDLQVVAALLSPSTGIVDSHALMLALRGDAEAAGAMIAFDALVQGGRLADGAIEIAVGGSEPGRWRARTLVNCAGLQAQAVAASLDGFPLQHVPPAYFAKGNYFSLARRTRFRHLVYPVPELAGLGVHLTLDLAGQVRFGPDVEWVDRLDYTVDPCRGEAFYAEVRKYWPGLPDGSLQADYAGIRPKLVGQGMPAADFRIDGSDVHGVAGLVHLFGIESPGLTAALAIGDEVLQRLG